MGTNYTLHGHIKKQYFRLSIILLTVAAVLVPLSIVGTMFYRYEKAYLFQAYGTTLSTIAQHSAEDIGNWMSDQKQTLTLLSKAETIVTTCDLLHKDKKCVEGQKRIKRIATVVLYAMDWAAEVKLADPETGIVYYSTDPGKEGTLWVPKCRMYEQHMNQLRQGEVVISEKSLSKKEADLGKIDEMAGATGFFSVMIKSGKIPLAIMTVRVKAGTLKDVILHNNVFLTDDQGRILTETTSHFPLSSSYITHEHSNESNVDSKRYLQKLQDKEGNPTLPLKEYKLFQQGLPYKQMLDKPYHNIDDILVVGAWAPVKEIPWMVVAEVPEKELLQPLHEALRLTVELTIFIAAIFCVAAAFLAQHLTQPLGMLTQVAQKFAQGNRNVRCSSKRGDEIGQFAETFNSMADKLEQNMQELEVARDKALDASRAKSRFLANMSHELRTPLNAIIGYSEMMLDDLDKDCPSHSDAQRIHLAGINLLAQINDVLDISKIEAGKMDIFLETFNLAELVLEIKANVSPLAQANNNSFTVNLAPNCTTICSDRTKVRQIVTNLLSNAFKFTKNGKVNLDIVSSQDNTLFVVSDEGIGMSNEQLSKVFDEFTQADNSTTRHYGGTGLGLTLVKRFSQMLNGSVKVESEVGKGTKFTVSLPTKAVLPKKENE